MTSRSVRGRRSGHSHTRGWPDDHPLALVEIKYRERLDNLSKLSIIPNRYMVMDDLVALGLRDEVLQFVHTMGWERFVDIAEPSYRELMLEFLSTIECDRLPATFNMPTSVRFRLGGRRHEFSIVDFAERIGFYSPAESQSREFLEYLVDFPRGVTKNYAWSHIGTGPSLTGGSQMYDPSQSKSSRILSPTLRYLHRYMTYTIMGRGESNGNVNSVELLCLFGMVTGQRCNLAAMMVNTFIREGGKKRGALCGGAYITRLAKNLGVFEPSRRWTRSCDMIALDLQTLSNMQLIDRRPDGSYYVIRRQQDDDDEEDPGLGAADVPPPHIPEDVPPPPPIPQDLPSSSGFSQYDFSARFDQLEAGLGGLRTDVDSLRHDVQDMHGVVDDLRVDMLGLGATVSSIDSRTRWMMQAMMQDFQARGIDYPPPPPED